MPHVRSLVLASLLYLVAFSPARAEEDPPVGFTIAAGGDIIGPRGQLTEALGTDFRQIADLFRNADLGIANLEGAVFDLATFEGFPAAENGGGYPLYPMTLLGELRDMGLTLVAKSNNHATDWKPFARPSNAFFQIMNQAGDGPRPIQSAQRPPAVGIAVASRRTGEVSP